MQHNKESDYSPPSRFSDPDSGRKESPNNWLYQSSENVLLVAKHHEGAQGVPPKDTPLPMKELFVIGCIFMSEVSPSYLQAKGVQYFFALNRIANECTVQVFSSSMLFPFVAFMVEDFGITDNKSDIGYYAGALASCFSFAQFISRLVLCPVCTNSQSCQFFHGKQCAHSFLLQQLFLGKLV